MLDRENLTFTYLDESIMLLSTKSMSPIWFGDPATHKIIRI